MTFINRLPAIVPSQGTPVQNDALFLKQTLVLTTTSAQTNVFPATGFVPTISKGKLRLKATAPAASGVSPAISQATFTLSDGVNFVEIGRITTSVLSIGAQTPSGSIPNNADRVLEFEVDINALYLYVVTTLTGTNPIVLLDVELSGTT